MIRLGVLFSGVCLSALSSAAMAQDAASASPADDDAIVVTARRQSESIRDVPASISVLTAATLKQAGVINTEQIVNLTPGVTIVSNAAQVGDAQINIRGVNGARDAENSVALVVDGILKTNTAALNSYQGELQQVEVLKGPQGAYYGRNAAAGAIVMTTKSPGDALAIDGKASYATRNSINAQGSISGPLAEGIGAVLYGNYRKTDGFYKNTGPDPATDGHTVDQYRGWNVGGRVVLDPTDRLKIDVKGRYGKVRAGALAYDVDFALPTFAAVLGSPLFDEDPNKHNFVFNRNIRGLNWQRTVEGSARGVYDMDWATLTGWVSYSNIKEDFISDAASASLGRFAGQASCQASIAALFKAGVTLPPPQFLGPTFAASLFGPFGPTTCDGIQYTVRDQRDISTELRLASKSGGPISWSIGGYYLNINRHYGTAINQDTGNDVAIRSLYNAPGTPNQTSQLLDDRFKTNVYAAFGSLDYKATDALTFSTALRFDREERVVDPLSPNAIDPVTGGPLNPGFAVGAIVHKEKAYQQLQPKVAIHYKASDEISLFADWGIGFKAGGFNSQGSAAIIDQNLNVPLGAHIGINDDYRKERSSAFEAGFKARTPGGRFTLEGAIYRTNVKDMQFFEFFTGGFGVLRVVSNIDKVRLTGGELSATARIVPGWTVFASGNYTDSKILKNASRPDTVGNESPYTAKYTINVGSQAVVPIASALDGTLRVDYRVTGPTWFHTVQAETVRTIFDLAFAGLGTADYSNMRRDTYGLVDLRAGINGKTWSVTAFARNLLNKKYLSEIIPSPEFGGAFLSPGDKRLIGVELGVNF